ncbi:MAG TPA: restriction endonuclease subunit M [Spirochaetota bacterium]|nr:restriction endonuclease subunit M [Spirochaetota bacterium]HQQ23184.1 restriction endonuclease subunit M [Spirochaetota bacterium]
MLKTGIDIKENEIVKLYPDVLDILLLDQTTKNNILWATDNYEHLGEKYHFTAQILPELITGINCNIIMPRVKKNIFLQQSRSKDMAEVFTPSWVCNEQNNLIDNAWFGNANVFNTGIKKIDTNSWIINKNKITFPENKTWKDYVSDRRLEIACGEAPYLTSRYDTTTGEFIPVEKRIGILDRKFRVINENVENIEEWFDAAETAFKSTYAFEYHGDSLLIAREAMLVTFIENYYYKFIGEPLLKEIQTIAYIVSWNVWQMDGLKGVIPKTCGTKTIKSDNLFGESEIERIQCEGCLKENMFKHNGIYCWIKNWNNKDPETEQEGQKIRFVDLFKSKE